jgi:hypothetical protein
MNLILDPLYLSIFNNFLVYTNFYKYEHVEISFINKILDRLSCLDLEIFELILTNETAIVLCKLLINIFYTILEC